MKFLTRNNHKYRPNITKNLFKFVYNLEGCCYPERKYVYVRGDGYFDAKIKLVTTISSDSFKLVNGYIRRNDKCLIDQRQSVISINRILRRNIITIDDNSLSQQLNNNWYGIIIQPVDEVYYFTKIIGLAIVDMMLEDVKNMVTFS